MPTEAHVTAQPPQVPSPCHSAVTTMTTMCQTLQVVVIPIPVHVIPVGELCVLLAVRDPSERRVIVEARVEDLVHDFPRRLSADFSHREDGTQGTVPDALLSEKNQEVHFKTNSRE